MLKSIKLYIPLIFLLFATGCASWFGGRPKHYEVAAKESPMAKIDFDNAIALIDRKDYKGAIKAFNDFLKKFPASKYELLAVYNLGVAYEGLDHCAAAVNRYRRLMSLSKGKFRRLEAQALLRMSYGYECLGKDTRVVASLIDLEKRINILPKEVAQAELPARMAAVYARLGNAHLAQVYFEKAQEGLKDINRNYRNPKSKKEILARTLYYMGGLSKHKLEKMKGSTYITSLATLQGYLLKSIEMNNKDWSPIARDELLQAYRDLWNFIADDQKKKDYDLAELALSNIIKLKEARFPDRNEPRLVSELFSQMDEYENRFKLLLANREERVKKTKQALEKESLRLDGRIITPNSSLENNYQGDLPKKK